MKATFSQRQATHTDLVDDEDYLEVPNWISYGIVIHPSGELQVVSDTWGDEGMGGDMEWAALMLVKALKRDGLLDRNWERIINGND